MDLVIQKQAYLKLKYYIDICDDEISGMGKSFVNEEGDIVMTDLVIFDQEVTGVHTEIDDESMVKFINELMDKKESPADWNIWWHSHADMKAYFSSTDDATIKSHSNHQTYLISLVGNKEEEYEARLDIFPKDESPYKLGKFHSKRELKVFIEKDDNEENKEEIEKLEEKLEEAKETAEKFITNIEQQISVLKKEDDPDLRKECEKEVKEKVRKKIVPKLFRKEKWGWSGKNQLGFDYNDDDDDYDYGHRGKGFGIKCPVCGYSKTFCICSEDEDSINTQEDIYTEEEQCPLCKWDKERCASIGVCALSGKHKEELDS
jgi:proteasome lid subunit RPN8/RPN11